MCLVFLKIMNLFGTNSLASIHDHYILMVQVKGQGIYAFVTIVDGVPYSEELRKSLILMVRNQVSFFILYTCSYDNDIFQDISFHGAVIASTLSSEELFRSLKILLFLSIAKVIPFRRLSLIKRSYF